MKNVQFGIIKEDIYESPQLREASPPRNASVVKSKMYNHSTMTETYIKQSPSETSETGVVFSVHILMGILITGAGKKIMII